MQKGRDAKGPGCKRAGMQKGRDAKGPGCNRAGMQKDRDAKRPGCKMAGMRKFQLNISIFEALPGLRSLLLLLKLKQKF